MVLNWCGVRNIMVAACTRARKRIFRAKGGFEVHAMVGCHGFRPGNWAGRILERSKANDNCC